MHPFWGRYNSICCGNETDLLDSRLSSINAASTRWAKTWCMLFIAGGSKHLSIFGNVTTPNPPLRVAMGTTLPKVTTQKHLGIMVHRSMKWSHHINNVYTACARKKTRHSTSAAEKKLHPAVLAKNNTGAIRLKME